MTRYPISSQRTETGLTEWEARMAKLVGLEESTPTDIEDTLPQPSPQELTENPDQQPLSANPFAKAGLVGAGTLGIVMFAGGFLTQIMSNDTTAQNAIITPTTPEPVTKPRRAQLEEEIEGLKTKLALSQQLEAIKTAQQKLRTIKPISSKPPLRAKSNPEVKKRTIPRDSYMSMIRPKSQTPAIRTVYVPKIVKVEVPRSQPKQVPQPVVERLKPTPKPLPVAPQTLPPAPPSVEFAAPSEPNPMEEWARLAKLGSYGQVSLNENQAVSNTTSSSEVRVSREMEEKETEIKPKRQNTTRIARQSVPKNRKTILVGSSAKAVLATAVSGETTKSDSEDNNVYVVRLKQYLKAADGTVALPVGTKIFTKIDSISENGLMQLGIMKIIMRENGKLVERRVPQDALVIRGKAGKPLVANQYRNNRRSTTSIDMTSFALGGLGKAAELVNRTESEVVTGENGTVAVTNVNRDPDIFASIVEGGTKSVIPQINRRNQSSINRRSRRTNIWFLPQGKKVEVFVNQEIQL